MASDDRLTHTATIAISGSASNAIPLGGNALVGMILPSTGTSDFAANTDRIYIYVSDDGTTYKTLKDNAGAAVAVTVAANNTNGATFIESKYTLPWRFVKVATHRNDTGAAVTQSAAVTITLISAKLSG